MSNLTEFLLARIAEDEAVAREGGQWDGGMEIAWRHVGGIEDSLVIGTDRVLAECEAKRRIASEYVEARDSNHGGEMRNYGYEEGLEEALRLLALPYASHPDYDEAWRP